MTMREFSTSLRNMKFMQRKEEKEKEDESHWVAPIAQAGTSGRCMVIMEGNPKPGAPLGRMSFGNFNPAIEKLHEQMTARKSELKARAAEINKASKSDNKAECSANGDEPTTQQAMNQNNEGRTEYSTEPDENEPQRKKLKTEPKAKACKSVASNNRFNVIQGKQGFRKPSR